MHLSGTIASEDIVLRSLRKFDKVQQFYSAQYLLLGLFLVKRDTINPGVSGSALLPRRSARRLLLRETRVVLTNDRVFGVG